MQEHRSAPYAAHVLEDRRSPAQIEPAAIAFVIVAQHERAVMPQLGDVYARGPEVESRSEYRLADAVDVVRGDLDPAAFRFEHEEPQSLHQLAIEIVADESEVVFFPADLARLVDAVLVHDVAPHRESKVVWIHRQRRLLLG